MTHPLPTIGTRYIRLSDEALCLDSASVARIQVSCIERPERPQHRPPKAIKTTVPAKVSRYARTVAASTARHARALADWDAYVHAPVVEVPYHVLGEPAPTPRLFLLLAGRHGQLYADIMTGCLFNEDGNCLSSGRVRIYPACTTTIARKTAARYIEMRKPRYNADESEAYSFFAGPGRGGKWGCPITLQPAPLHRSIGRAPCKSSVPSSSGC